MKQSFIELANKLMLGKRIDRIEYMSVDEAREFGWHKRPIIIILDDGTELYPQMDDEGNDGGALSVYNKKEPKTGKSFYTLFPVFSLGDE